MVVDAVEGTMRMRMRKRVPSGVVLRRLRRLLVRLVDVLILWLVVLQPFYCLFSISVWVLLPCRCQRKSLFVETSLHFDQWAGLFQKR